MTTNITERHKKSFESLISGEFNNFILMSCFLDGKPAVAICSAVENLDGSTELYPLFIAHEDWMKLTDHDGIEPNEAP